MAGAAALAVAVVAAYLYFGQPNSIVGPGATQSPSPSPTAVPTSTPTPAPRTPPPVSPSPQVRSVSNGWIAYSTMPGGLTMDGETQVALNDTQSGSDIYLAREGVDPILVASRDGGTTRNVCPAFSPDGTKLAFGEVSTSGRAVMVFDVLPDGTVGDVTRIPVRATGDGVCSLWSADGTRLAYVEAGEVVVRGLDGSEVPAGDGDPTLESFGILLETDSLVSPDGEWTVDGFELVRLDGSDSRTFLGGGSAYSFAAWSPDSTKILVMGDVGGQGGSAYVTIQAMSIEPPHRSVTIVSQVTTNGSRSYPGRGDVSWQPVYP